MSLTRAQWEDMWASIKVIEAMTRRISEAYVRSQIRKEVDNIKDQIESVIGQME